VMREKDVITVIVYKKVQQSMLESRLSSEVKEFGPESEYSSLTAVSINLSLLALLCFVKWKEMLLEGVMLCVPPALKRPLYGREV
jgi:hypothetical protein